MGELGTATSDRGSICEAASLLTEHLSILEKRKSQSTIFMKLRNVDLRIFVTQTGLLSKAEMT